MLDAASSRLLTTSDGGWFGQIKPIMLIPGKNDRLSLIKRYLLHVQMV
jgi:hypothetical protein